MGPGDDVRALVPLRKLDPVDLKKNSIQPKS